MLAEAIFTLSKGVIVGAIVLVGEGEMNVVVVGVELAVGLSVLFGLATERFCVST